MRAVARDLKVADRDIVKFRSIFLYHFRKQRMCDQNKLDAVAEKMARIAPIAGRSYRDDAVCYLLNDKKVCIREAANITGREPDQIRSVVDP